MARPLTPVPSGPRRSDAPTQGRRAREIATSSRSPAHGWPGRPGTSAAPTLRPPPPRHRPAAGAPGSTGTGERGLRSSTRAPPAQPHRAQAPQQRPGGPSAPRRGLRMVLMPRGRRRDRTRPQQYPRGCAARPAPGAPAAGGRQPGGAGARTGPGDRAGSCAPRRACAWRSRPVHAPDARRTARAHRSHGRRQRHAPTQAGRQRPWA